MINSINRVRRLSVHDDWPSCDFCCENFTSGFTFYLDADHGDGTVNVCDGCLGNAKKADFGWLRQNDTRLSGNNQSVAETNNENI